MEDQELEIIDSVHREDFTQYTVRFNWTPQEKTQGYLLVPDGDRKEKKPAVITVYYEPETAIGKGQPQRDFASRQKREEEERQQNINQTTEYLREKGYTDLLAAGIIFVLLAALFYSPSNRPVDPTLWMASLSYLIGLHWIVAYCVGGRSIG